MRPRWGGAYFFFVVFVILSGCSYDETISKHAVKYNETVARADNANLLLNILRARDRQPAHFTAISLVRGSLALETTGGVTLELPFANTAIPVAPTLSMTQTSSPSFDVAVLDSKEFMSGILSPIRMETFKYYIDQRWSPAVIFHLLVHRIKVSRGFIEHGGFCGSKKDAAIKKEIVDYAHREGVERNGFVMFLNEPPTGEESDGVSDESFRQFLNFVHCMSNEMLENRLQLRKVVSGDPVGPRFRLTDKEIPANTLLAEKEDLRLVRMPGDVPAFYRLCKPKNEIVFCFEHCSLPTFEERCARADKGARAKVSGSKAKSAASAGKGRASRNAAPKRYFREGAFGETTENYDSAIYMRSVQNVIYHLGAILRYQERSHHFVRAEGVKLFHLTTNQEEADRPEISVNYGGVTYYIPKGDDFAAKDVMTILIQLIGQYKNGSDLPTTTAVQAVGS